MTTQQLLWHLIKGKFSHKTEEFTNSNDYERCLVWNWLVIDDVISWRLYQRKETQNFFNRMKFIGGAKFEWNGLTTVSTRSTSNVVVKRRRQRRRQTSSSTSSSSSSSTKKELLSVQLVLKLKTGSPLKMTRTSLNGPTLNWLILAIHPNLISILMCTRALIVRVFLYSPELVVLLCIPQPLTKRVSIGNSFKS